MDVYLIKRSPNQIYPTENDSQLTYHRPTTSVRTSIRNSLRRTTTTSNNDQSKDISHITISNMKHCIHRTNRSSTFSHTKVKRVKVGIRKTRSMNNDLPNWLDLSKRNRITFFPSFSFNISKVLNWSRLNTLTIYIYNGNHAFLIIN